MSKLFKKKVSTAKSLDAAPAAETPLPAVSASSTVSLGGAVAADLSDAKAEAAAARSEADKLRAQVAQLTEENGALKGQIHLLKFKTELLVDMVTLANLDCDKLEDELEAATEAPQ